MFCIMDVSGSMDQKTKEMAKRFFLLLYLFLKRSYKDVEVVYIRHHTQAKEVDEQEFFYSQETGGTIVSSALKLMSEIIQSRYPSNDWKSLSANRKTYGMNIINLRNPTIILRYKKLLSNKIFIPCFVSSFKKNQLIKGE